MSMLRIVIATCLGVLLAVVVLYGSCAYLETREMRRALFAPPSASFQERMLQQGYPISRLNSAPGSRSTACVTRVASPIIR
jgi:hypothetical protein